MFLVTRKHLQASFLGKNRLGVILRPKMLLETECQLKKHQKDLEKLAEGLMETLDQYPVTGENADEAVSKVEADAFDYID